MLEHVIILFVNWMLGIKKISDVFLSTVHRSSNVIGKVNAKIIQWQSERVCNHVQSSL